MNSKYLIPILLLLLLFAYYIFPIHKQILRDSRNMPAQNTCSSFFLNWQEPIFPYTEKPSSLCYNHYKVYFSRRTMTGIITAEKLTSQQIEQAKHIKRNTDFDHQDPIIQNYTKSGYDRGHLTPSADMPDSPSQEQTFIWQNIAPEIHKLNAGKWEQIERWTRTQALQYGKIYILTGVYGNHGKNIHEIMVPDYFYKAYYIPVTKESGVYLCKNTEQDTCFQKTVAEFKRITQIDLFPGLAN